MESSKMITVEPDDRAFSAEFWSIPDHAGLPYDAVLAALHRISAAEVVHGDWYGDWVNA